MIFNDAILLLIHINFIIELSEHYCHKQRVAKVFLQTPYHSAKILCVDQLKNQFVATIQLTLIVRVIKELQYHFID